jgi:dipeptidyl aminopeptidase/acylaminoacyl peptidase
MGSSPLLCLIAHALAAWSTPAFLDAQLPPPANADSASPPLRPLAVNEVLNLRRLAFGMPVVLSPDGRWVAYTLRNPARLQTIEGAQAPYFTPNGVSGYAVGCELWITNTATGESHDLSSRHGVSWGGSWSPDGRFLAFYSDRDGVPQIWIWDNQRQTTRRISRLAVRPFEGADLMRWTSDGKRLVVKLDPGTDPASAADDRQKDDSVSVLVYRAQTGASKKERVAPPEWLAVTLAEVTVATGVARELVHMAPIAGYFMSPSGHDVALTVVRGSEVGSQDNRNDIVVVSLDDGGKRTLASNIPQTQNGLAVSWSPDGEKLAYTTQPVGDTIPEECFVVTLSGGGPVNITPGPHPPIGDYGRGPLWDAGGERLYLLGADTIWQATTDGRPPTPVAAIAERALLSIVAPEPGNAVWSPDSGRSIYVRTRDRKSGNTGFAQIDLATGHSHIVFEEAAAGHVDSYSRFDVDVRGSTIVYPVERGDTPEDLWLAPADFRYRSRLTHMNPTLEQRTFGRSRLVDWLGLDGDSLRGTVLLPAGYVAGRRYPLIVWLYGGWAGSENMNRFGLDPDAYNLQLLATRGYAVLAPDAPLRTAHPMEDLAKTVLPGVNKLIELGIADPTRLGVAGHSYGGYSTLALLVQTPRFRAAVDIAGAANLLTVYGQLSDGGISRGVAWAESGQGRMGASPWERRDRYLENSPFFYLDRLTTPLLVLHGTQDHAVPAFASDEIFTALHRLHKEVAYAKYPGAGHALNQSGVRYQCDFYRRIIDWFGSHLGPAGMADADETATQEHAGSRASSADRVPCAI